MTSTFFGSCHCGTVRFSCELDATAPTSRCNCSICRKTRLWKTAPLPSHAFRLLQGSSSLIEYRPSGRRVAHMFCSRCGIKGFGHGGKDACPSEFYVVNIATLDDLAEDFLAALPVGYQDGRHDDWQSAPTQTSHL